MSGPQYKKRILDEMQRLYDSIEKNISQMDLENNEARDEMDAIAGRMKARINQSMTTVDNCSFKL